MILGLSIAPCLVLILSKTQVYRQVCDLPADQADDNRSRQVDARSDCFGRKGWLLFYFVDFYHSGLLCDFPLVDSTPWQAFHRKTCHDHRSFGGSMHDRKECIDRNHQVALDDSLNAVQFTRIQLQPMLPDQLESLIEQNRNRGLYEPDGRFPDLLFSGFIIQVFNR